jgi:hypothetical protein
MKDNATTPEPRLVSEIKQFTAMGAWCTPEFLIQSSQTHQDTFRVGQEQSRASSTMTGRYLASRNPLAGDGQIDSVIGELRQLLESACDDSYSTNRNDLLQVWMSLERCLNEDEHRQLSASVLDRLFPGDKVPTGLNRERTSRLGGY